MSKDTPPKDLGSLIAGVFQQKNLHRRLKLHQVFLFWDQVVGKEIGRHAQPHLIRGDVLWIRVSDSVWMQQLQFEKQTILDKVNRRLDKESRRQFTASGKVEPLLLADIRFDIAPPGDLKNEVNPPVVERVSIDPEKLRAFERVLSSVEDEKIRASMKRIWLAMQGGEEEGT